MPDFNKVIEDLKAKKEGNSIDLMTTQEKLIIKE